MEPHATRQRVELNCLDSVSSLSPSGEGQEGAGYFPGVAECETEIGQLLFASAETRLVKWQRGPVIGSPRP